MFFEAKQFKQIAQPPLHSIFLDFSKHNQFVPINFFLNAPNRLRSASNTKAILGESQRIQDRLLNWRNINWRVVEKNLHEVTQAFFSDKNKLSLNGKQSPFLLLAQRALL